MKALRVLSIMMILMAFSILQPLAFNDLNVSTAETQVSCESILTQGMIDEFMQELNDFRAEEGLQPVVYNAGIQAGADIRAGESAIEFDHTRPNGEGFSTAFENPNEPSRMENIAGGYATVSAVFQGWKDSEGHRANMLIPDLQSVVLGVNNPGEDAGMSPFWALIGSGYAGIPDNDEESEEDSEGEEEESESEETEEGTETEETEEGTETEETEEGTETEETEEGTETEETEEGTETEETEEGTETEETEEGTETEETEEGTETEEDDAAEEEADQLTLKRQHKKQKIKLMPKRQHKKQKIKLMPKRQHKKQKIKLMQKRQHKKKKMKLMMKRQAKKQKMKRKQKR